LEVGKEEKHIKQWTSAVRQNHMTLPQKIK